MMQKRQAPFLFLYFALNVAAALLSSSPARAQPKGEHSVDVFLGAALTAPYERQDVTGTGPYIGATFSAPLEPYVGLHAYGALMFTLAQNTKDREACPSNVECDVTAQVLMIGGKARLSAPVPWVAPFAEAGLGLSFGSITTRTRAETIEVGPAAATMHVPVGVGLALGSMHETELAVTAIFHPEVKQYAVALSLTLSVPIERPHRGHHKEKPWWKFF